jgi:hypothetical protein
MHRHLYPQPEPKRKTISRQLSQQNTINPIHARTCWRIFNRSSGATAVRDLYNPQNVSLTPSHAPFHASFASHRLSRTHTPPATPPASKLFAIAVNVSSGADDACVAFVVVVSALALVDGDIARGGTE